MDDYEDALDELVYDGAITRNEWAVLQCFGSEAMKRTNHDPEIQQTPFRSTQEKEDFVKERRQLRRKNSKKNFWSREAELKQVLCKSKS